MSILQVCPSRPLAICGLLFFEGLISEDAQPGADVDVPLDDEALEAFPPGITVVRATPARGTRGVPTPVPLCPPPWRTSGQNGGALPPLPPPPVRRDDAPCEGVDTRCRRPTGLYPIGFGQSVPTRVQCGFPGTSWTTTARASSSESGALGLLKGRVTSCATYARHLPSERVTPIRRHVLDPRRRKSSIISRLLEAGIFCSIERSSP